MFQAGAARLVKSEVSSGTGAEVFCVAIFAAQPATRADCRVGASISSARAGTTPNGRTNLSAARSGSETW